MMSIFISYRRRDAAFAGRLRDRLELAFPKEVFLDVYGIGLAVDFARIIESAIARSRVVVALIGADWLYNSDRSHRLGDLQDNVTVELHAALKLGVPLVPVLIDAAELPPDGRHARGSLRHFEIQRASLAVGRVHGGVCRRQRADRHAGHAF